MDWQENQAWNEGYDDATEGNSDSSGINESEQVKRARLKGFKQGLRDRAKRDADAKAYEEREQQRQVREDDRAYQANNPGDFECPYCLLVSLKRYARRCPICRGDVPQSYWQRVAESEEAKRQRNEEMRRRAEDERKRKEAAHQAWIQSPEYAANLKELQRNAAAKKRRHITAIAIAISVPLLLLISAILWVHKWVSASHGVRYGLLCERGVEVVKDDVEAVRWYRKSAEWGYAEGMYNLARMYSNGKGVTADDVEAIRWYQRAASAGNREAMNEIAYRYKNGDGLVQSDMEAVKWWQKATVHDGTIGGMANPIGMLELGEMYELGRGVPKDDAIAVKWYYEAARRGSVAAKGRVGWAYVSGRVREEKQTPGGLLLQALLGPGLSKNLELRRPRGIELLREAAAKGDEWSKTKLAEIGEPISTGKH